jgi:D-glucuronyl C5-epimerase C-terminus
MPYPAVGDQVSFRGSEVLYQHFAGQGLQLHPLSTFKKANAMYGFCNRREAACDEAGHRRLLDEMASFAVRRGRRFIAWEYMFHFGGGSPPWMSGMAQATGIQALGRAASLWNEPSYAGIARRALGAFTARPPRGVRTTGPRGGVHYLQYSFAPRLYIFNAFLQSLIGLYDFSNLANDERARRLYARAVGEGRAEVPLSDVGDWSRYSYAGAESTPDYHELLREFLASLCSRRQGAVFCEYARKYRGYQVDPPEVAYRGPATATEDRPVSLGFSLSKLSAVQVTVRRPDGSVVFDRLATFRRGGGSFTWTPRGPSTFSVRVATKELRTGLGKRDSETAEIVVENRPG